MTSDRDTIFALAGKLDLSGTTAQDWMIGTLPEEMIAGQ